jgi:quercetin dioxygenase-like cupin family protein
MALKRVEPSEVVNLDTITEEVGAAGSYSLTKNDAFQAILMRLPKGKLIDEHSVDGPLIVQCLEGAVEFPVDGSMRTLSTGDWMYLPGGTPHAVEVLVDTRLLVTILFLDEP